MAAFEYAAIDAGGRRKKGVIEGDSGRHVRQLLRDQGFMPLSVSEAREGASLRKARAADGSVSVFAKLASTITERWTSWFGSMSALELALFTRQFATLIAAGLPVEEALVAVAQQNERRRTSSLIMGVRSRVLEGHSLAAALSSFPRTFSPMYRSTVAAGEQSGYLDAVLHNLATYTEQHFESTRNIQMALFYPILLFLVSVCIVAGLMIYVVPDIVDVFAHTGGDLPPLTAYLIAFSEWLNEYLWLTVLVIIGVALGVRWILSRPDIRLRWDRRKLSLPLAGRIGRGGNAARFANTLSILTSSGVPLVEAMRIASEVVTNTWLKNRLAIAVQRVSEGSSLRVALTEVGYFPQMFLHMVGSGEASGQLDEMLMTVAGYQQQELERLVQTLVQLFQPLMLICMASMVLLIVLAILMPILSMNQLAI